jgi:exoribonuclease R
MSYRQYIRNIIQSNVPLSTNGLCNPCFLVTAPHSTTNTTGSIPHGHFARALGKAESKEAEQDSLLLEFKVPYQPFGKAILDCLPREGEQWVVPPKVRSNTQWKDREDIGDLIICSIDPP